MEDNTPRQHRSDCEGHLEYIRRRPNVGEWNETIWSRQALSYHDDVRLIILLVNF
jgi:hypothetical protein